MIRIRPYKDSDEAVILTWCRDEETFYKWTFGVLGEYPITKEKFRKTGQYRRFTATDGEEVVGFFIARNPGDDPQQLRFGYVIIDPDRQGQGIGTEMIRQGLRYAFDDYGAKRVSLGVFEDNKPAYYCYTACGFTRTGKVESYEVAGRTFPVIEMEAKPHR